MPEKVTIAYRGAKFEIGRGKRFYGIWVTGAPTSDPIDRWPENRDGWIQAWARFTAIETPGTISQVSKPRKGFNLALRKRGTDSPDARTTTSAARAGRPSGATVGAGLLGLGVLLGVIGLFPRYVGLQSLASEAGNLVPHLIYLVVWAASGALIALGARRSRPQIPRLGALLGTGLSAVTFGLFFVDLGQVISGNSSLLGAGLILSILGWFACAAGSLVALFSCPRTAAAAQPIQVQPWFVGPPPARPSEEPDQPSEKPAQPSEEPEQPSEEPPPAAAAPAQPFTGPLPAMTMPAMTMPAMTMPAVSSAAGHPHNWHASAASPSGRAGMGGPAKPRWADAGPVALVLLAAIGAVAAFAPSWDSYTLTQPATGASQTVTLGNAFANPGVVIAGNVAVMIAVVAVAVLAALWRPVRHGAVLLAGAAIPLAAQAISALIEVREPVSPSMFNLSPSAGVTITSGVTPIFWVYCVFVISLVVSCAWMLTAPRYPAMPGVPQSPAPGPVQSQQGVADEDDDSDDDAEDDAESTYA